MFRSLEQEQASLRKLVSYTNNLIYGSFPIIINMFPNLPTGKTASSSPEESCLEYPALLESAESISKIADAALEDVTKVMNEGEYTMNRGNLLLTKIQQSINHSQNPIIPMLESNLQTNLNADTNLFLQLHRAYTIASNSNKKLKTIIKENRE